MHDMDYDDLAMSKLGAHLRFGSGHFSTNSIGTGSRSGRNLDSNQMDGIGDGINATLNGMQA